jgi:hypothetical protein
MDPNASGGNFSQQPQPAPEPQAQVVPMGENWAPGVYPAPVAPRGRKLRWGIAGAVVLCVALVTGAGIFVLSGASGSKSLTASLAPKTTVVFLEIRTDLPGNQHAKLADFMSHFPGFKDRGQFDTALDEALNRLTGAISPDFKYTSAFKPWMEGEVSVAVTSLGHNGTDMMTRSGTASPIPAVPDVTSPIPAVPAVTSTSTAPGMVAIFALKDRPAAQTWISAEIAKVGTTTSSQDYAGSKVVTIGTGASAEAYAFTDQDLIVGTVDGVKASLDTKTMGSLADSASYQTAMGSLSGDSLARFYMDPRAIVGYYLDSYNSIIQMMGSGSSMLPSLNLSATSEPLWIVGSVSADSNQMVVNVVMPRPDGLAPAQANHVSDLAGYLPGNTVAIEDVHSIGKIVTDELAAVDKAMPGNSTVASVQSALKLVGGLDWLGDGAIVVTKQGQTFDGGIVAETTDAATASAKVALVTNLIALGGSSMGLTSRTESYKGVEITLVHSSSTAISTGGTEIGVAANGKFLVAGSGDAFIKSVIDTTQSTSLAAQSDYKAVIALTGESNAQSAYVNVPALQDQIGQAMLGISQDKWNQDYKPYFDHLGGVGFSVLDGNTVILRLIVTAK